jgi:hypothetical protein
MDFLIDLKKLFGRKIISLFIWLYIYCFLFPLNSNFFMCSYLRVELTNIENNITFVLLFFIIFIIYSYIKNTKHSGIKINNYINVKYLYFYIREHNLIYILSLFLNNLYINLKNILNLYINKNYFLILYNMYIKLRSCNLVWYPIYKSYSIFGYYKSTRLKFIDLKNENLKRLKY